MFARLRFLTAGESHGTALTGILDGMVAGVSLTPDDFALQMRRRRHGHGRSPRQQLEQDVVEVCGGLRYGVTTGAPLALRIQNHEAARWADTLSPWPVANPVDKRTVPRPGHADRAGLTKYALDDVRDILERASARETAMRVALSVVPRAFLGALGIEVGSHVTQVGEVRAAVAVDATAGAASLSARADASAVRCLDDDAAAQMIARIDAAKRAGDTLGGAFVVVATGVPVGLGSHVQYDRRLSAKLSAALASIHSVKAVAVGDGAAIAAVPGTAAHDVVTQAGRVSNHAGGLEGGMSNGEPVLAEVFVKALSTVPGGLVTTDIVTGEETRGLVERSDVCAVPAAAVIGEAMMCFALADAVLETFGGDALAQVRAHLAASRPTRPAHPTTAQGR
jgi:chorismate synthase